MADSGYPSYGDLYSDPVTNPNHIVPTSSVPGQEHLVSAIGQVLGPSAPAGDVRDALRSYTNTYDWGGGGGSAPSSPSLSLSGGGGGSWGGGWGGGGGGGGGGGIDQAQLDWISDLLGRGEPDPITANRLDLPAYRSKFHPQIYNRMMNRFNRAVGIDQRRANAAYQRLGKFTRKNFRNAYTGPNARFATMAQAPGMDQRQMARMAQNQGVDPSVVGEQLEGAAAADQGFRNLWSVLGANERQAQQNRLGAIRSDRATTADALRIAALQGRTGIGLQKAQAKDAWRQRVEDARNAIRQQEALANFQQANTVQQFNATNSNSFRNNLISAFIGLIPSLAEGVDMPDINELLGIEPGVSNKIPGEKIGSGPGKGRRVKIPEKGPQGKGPKGRRGGK